MRKQYLISRPVEPDAVRAGDIARTRGGDLAHIALAGKHFVPHYAVPQPRAVLPGGAALFAETSEGAEELCTLMEGDSFEVLDISGGWAWGCLSLDGPVGYVRLDRLELLA